MNAELAQLVAEVAQLTGEPPPDLLRDDAPVPVSQQEDFYLIGLIGGKDVGKSSFVNALVGKEITEVSGHGRGTHEITAYTHASRADALDALLASVAPGRYRIVKHHSDALQRQVLLDLPDIDSIYDDHIELTRKLLRHMLFPIWITSFDKYADQHPQKMLLRVAEGNDPSNFLFCINKVDLLTQKFGASAAEELKRDYAQRLSKLLGRNSISVQMVSARQPEQFDFPSLSRLLSQQKTVSAVESSADLAQRQADRTLLRWIDSQNLTELHARALRLRDASHELLSARVVQPLLEEAIPRMTSDPGYRLSMVEPVVSKRLSRWAVVNAIGALLSPLTAMVRLNVATVARQGDLCEYLAEPPSSTLAGTFAQLQLTQPALGDLYCGNRLWEPMHAETAVRSLNRRIAATIDRQKTALVQRLAGTGVFSFLTRFILTIGVILWFPLLQPVAEALLQETVLYSLREVLLLVVKLFSVAYLLQQAVFLLIYFVALWALLRWQTHAKVLRVLEQWNRSLDDPQLSLQQQVIDWTDELLTPLTVHVRRVEELISRADALR